MKLHNVSITAKAAMALAGLYTATVEAATEPLDDEICMEIEQFFESVRRAKHAKREKVKNTIIIKQPQDINNLLCPGCGERMVSGAYFSVVCCLNENCSRYEEPFYVYLDHQE